MSEVPKDTMFMNSSTAQGLTAQLIWNTMCTTGPVVSKARA
jgi:hypothetical protein